MKVSFFVLLILLSLQSCKKEPLSYIIEGTVTDEFTEKVVANVKIDLFQKIFVNNVLNDNFKFVETITTDAEGKYSFEIPRERIHQIKLDLSNSQYYERSVTYSSSKLTTANANVFDETLESKAWVRFIITNPIIEPEEKLNIFKTNFREGCEDCCGNGAQSFFETGDTTFKCPTVGGQEVIVNYGEVGSPIQFTERVVCVPFDTTLIYIQY